MTYCSNYIIQSKNINWAWQCSSDKSYILIALRQKQRFNSYCFSALFLLTLMAIDVRCSAPLITSISTAWAFYLFSLLSLDLSSHPTIAPSFEWRPFWKTGSKWIKIFAALKNWRFYNFLNSPISNSCCNTLTGGPWKKFENSIKNVLRGIISFSFGRCWGKTRAVLSIEK